MYSKQLIDAVRYLHSTSRSKSLAVVCITRIDDQYITLQTADRICLSEIRLDDPGSTERFLLFTSLSSLYKSVSKLKCDTISISPSGELTAYSVKLGDTFKCQLPIITELRYVDINPPTSINSVDHKSIVSKLQRVIKCSGVSMESPRNYGTVINFHNSDHRIVGTDGYHLAHATASLNLPDFTLDVRNCNAIIKLPSSDRSSDAQIYTWGLDVDAQTLTVSSLRYTLQLRTSQVKYPNYKAVIPKPTCIPGIEIPQISDQLKSLISIGDKSRAVDLVCDGSTLTVSNSVSQFQVAMMQSMPKRRVNGRWLLDALNPKSVSKLHLEVDSTTINALDVTTVIVHMREGVSS